MLDTEITVNRFLIGYCRMLVGELDDAGLAEQPLPGVNHPAWILGHLAFAAYRGKSLIVGGENEMQENWKSLFGPGSKLTADRAHYPALGELLRAVEESYETLRQAASKATPEQLAQPSQNPRTKEALPTIKDAVAFLLTGHLGVHLGQLSMWRRMIGLPALF